MDTFVRVSKTCFSTNAPRSNCDMQFADRNGVVEIPRLILDTE